MYLRNKSIVSFEPQDLGRALIQKEPALPPNPGGICDEKFFLFAVAFLAFAGCQTRQVLEDNSKVRALPPNKEACIISNDGGPISIS